MRYSGPQFAIVAALVFPFSILFAQASAPTLSSGGGLKGYIANGQPNSPGTYSYGVSFYAAAWPLLAQPVAS